MHAFQTNCPTHKLNSYLKQRAFGSSYSREFMKLYGIHAFRPELKLELLLQLRQKYFGWPFFFLHSKVDYYIHRQIFN